MCGILISIRRKEKSKKMDRNEYLLELYKVDREKYLNERYNDCRQDPKYASIPDNLLKFDLLITNLITDVSFSNLVFPAEVVSEEVIEAITLLRDFFIGVVLEGLYAKETIEKMHEIMEEDNQ